MREALGIDAPNFGSLWDDMATDGTLGMSRLRHPKAEPEFAFLADGVLSGSQVSAGDVQRAGRWSVGCWVGLFELERSVRVELVETLRGASTALSERFK